MTLNPGPERVHEWERNAARERAYTSGNNNLGYCKHRSRIKTVRTTITLKQNGLMVVSNIEGTKDQGSEIRIASDMILRTELMT